MKLAFWVGGVIVIFLAAMFGLGVFLSQNDLVGCEALPDGSSDCETADVIVAISGGDTAARTRKAIELYQAGWADTIVFAGAAADPNSPSNAEQMRDIALSAGVPDSAIILDEMSRNTSENAKNVANILLEKGWVNVILVSENYHLRRAKLSFTVVNPALHIRTIAARENDMWWLAPHGWILEFSELGGMIKLWLGGGR